MFRPLSRSPNIKNFRYGGPRGRALRASLVFITILLASKLGLPISTTHALVGAVLGVGLNRGLQALNLQMVREIVISWIVTIPLCAGLSIAAFYGLKLLYGAMS